MEEQSTQGRVASHLSRIPKTECLSMTMLHIFAFSLSKHTHKRIRSDKEKPHQANRMGSYLL